MSSAPWTPGPWEIDTATRPAEVCTIHNLPCELTNCQGWAYVRGAIGYWDADEAENMANARLIAAAPDLYAQLAESQAELESIYDELKRHQSERSAQQFLSLMNANRAALAKARGES